MIGFLGTLVTLAFLVYLVLAIRSRKKGSPKARQQFRIMWILLGGVVLLTIIDPNNGQTMRKAQHEQTVAVQEATQAEPAPSTTSSQSVQASKVETPSNAQPASSDTTETTQTLDKEAVLTYTSILRGSNFIKEVNVGKNTISITFFSSFKQYQAVNPQSEVTKNNYQDYFSTGDAINKILMEESTRLLKEFPAANLIKMTLPFDDKVYSVELTKEAAEKFYNGIDFSTLKSSNGWSAISNNYFNDTDRQHFVDRFIKVN